MRIIEGVKKFIIDNKKKQKFVFSSKDIPGNIKTYLLKENMLYSPIRGIYVLKKSEMMAQEAIQDHLFEIISLLGGVISGKTALKIHAGDIKNIKKFHIITKNKNFETYIGDGKNIGVKFVSSQVPRITQKMIIGGAKLEVESVLSTVINNSQLLEKYPKIHKKLFQKEITSEKIETLIKKKFKVSGLSKLAIFYQAHGFNEKFIIIRNVIKNSGKRLDSRNTANIEKILPNREKKTQKKFDLNSLL